MQNSIVLLAAAALVLPSRADVIDEPVRPRPAETIIDLRNHPVRPAPRQVEAGDLPQVSVWTNRDEPLRRGQRVRVFFEATDDAYVTVFRIDTDGRVSVLFPLGPWDHGFARGGRRYEVRPHSSRYAFTATDAPGEGYVFAAASVVPFDFSVFAYGTRWNFERFGRNGHVTGDPYVAITDLIDAMAPLDAVYPSFDIVPYFVGRQVSYPRFVCYDCHDMGRYGWDPYRDPCYRFTLVVYDDPEYYPARIRKGTRVVFTRSTRLEPRYVFVNRKPSEPAVDVRSRRPENTMQRRRVTERSAPRRPAARPNVQHRRRPDASAPAQVTPRRLPTPPSARPSPRRRPAVRDTTATRRPAIRRRPANPPN